MSDFPQQNNNSYSDSMSQLVGLGGELSGLKSKLLMLATELESTEAEAQQELLAAEFAAQKSAIKQKLLAAKLAATVEAAKQDELAQMIAEEDIYQDNIMAAQEEVAKHEKLIKTTEYEMVQNFISNATPHLQPLPTISYPKNPEPMVSSPHASTPLVAQISQKYTKKKKMLLKKKTKKIAEQINYSMPTYESYDPPQSVIHMIPQELLQLTSELQALEMIEEEEIEEVQVPQSEEEPTPSNKTQKTPQIYSSMDDGSLEHVKESICSFIRDSYKKQSQKNVDPKSSESKSSESTSSGKFNFFLSCDDSADIFRYSTQWENQADPTTYLTDSISKEFSTIADNSNHIIKSENFLCQSNIFYFMN